jgi:hypothetical protein
MGEMGGKITALEQSSAQIAGAAAELRGRRADAASRAAYFPTTAARTADGAGMRFEVNVDDGAGLNALHRRPGGYENERGQSWFRAGARHADLRAAADGPGRRFGALEPLGPTTLGAAITKIAELQAAKVSLEQEVASLTPAVEEQVKPATPT